MSLRIKPYDNPRLFWDVDHSKMDYDSKANFIIERVFDRGDVQDIRDCRSYYGDEKIKEALKNAKFLREMTLEFVSNLYNISKTKFRCYALRLSNPGLFPY